MSLDTLYASLLKLNTQPFLYSLPQTSKISSTLSQLDVEAFADLLVNIAVLFKHYERIGQTSIQRVFGDVQFINFQILIINVSVETNSLFSLFAHSSSIRDVNAQVVQATVAISNLNNLLQSVSVTHVDISIITGQGEVEGQGTSTLRRVGDFTFWVVGIVLAAPIAIGALAYFLIQLKDVATLPVPLQAVVASAFTALEGNQFSPENPPPFLYRFFFSTTYTTTYTAVIARDVGVLGSSITDSMHELELAYSPFNAYDVTPPILERAYSFIVHNISLNITHVFIKRIGVQGTVGLALFVYGAYITRLIARLSQPVSSSLTRRPRAIEDGSTRAIQAELQNVTNQLLALQENVTSGQLDTIKDVQLLLEGVKKM